MLCPACIIPAGGIVLMPVAYPIMRLTPYYRLAEKLNEAVDNQDSITHRGALGTLVRSPFERHNNCFQQRVYSFTLALRLLCFDITTSFAKGPSAFNFLSDNTDLETLEHYLEHSQEQGYSLSAHFIRPDDQRVHNQRSFSVHQSTIRLLARYSQRIDPENSPEVVESCCQAEGSWFSSFMNKLSGLFSPQSGRSLHHHDQSNDSNHHACCHGS